MSTDTDEIDQASSQAGQTDLPWKIFINYRREDASAEARLLYERLVKPFGAENVFLDVINLRAGQKWLQEIKSHATRSGVFLVVIGPRWLQILKKRAQDNFGNADPDIVELEIKTALGKGSTIDVIPVIIGEATPPTEDSLPKSLRPLAARHIEHIRIDDALDHDVDHLIDSILRIAREKPVPEVVAEPLTESKQVDHGTIVGNAHGEHYEEVLDYIVHEGTLVPLLGSRVNACDRTEPWQDDSGTLPDDMELADNLARRFRLESQSRDLAEVSQYVSETRGKPDLYRSLRQILGAESKPNSVHRYLSLLPSRLAALDLPKRYQLIITTNYDNSLELAFQEAEEPYDLAVYMASGPFKGRFVHFPFDGEPEVIAVPNKYTKLPVDDDLELERSLIVKIHGAVDGGEGSFQWKENYVITEDQYIEYLSESPADSLIPIQILQKLKSCHCLFLGYTMRDWRLRVFLKRIWPGGSIEAKSWAIEESPDLLEKEFWSHAGRVDLLNASLAEYVTALNSTMSTLSQAPS